MTDIILKDNQLLLNGRILYDCQKVIFYQGLVYLILLTDINIIYIGDYHQLINNQLRKITLREYYACDFILYQDYLLVTGRQDPCQRCYQNARFGTKIYSIHTLDYLQTLDWYQPETYNKKYLIFGSSHYNQRLVYTNNLRLLGKLPKSHDGDCQILGNCIINQYSISMDNDHKRYIFYYTSSRSDVWSTQQFLKIPNQLLDHEINILNFDVSGLPEIIIRSFLIEEMYTV